MYTRLHNSCTYIVNDDYFDIQSDFFHKSYRFKGIPKESAIRMLKMLNDGILENKAIEILSSVPCNPISKISSLVSFLTKIGFLIKRDNIANNPPQDTLYDRQIRYLDTYETEAHTGNDFNEQLQNHKIVIVGLGAYGTWLALHCSRLGIRHLVGVDFDRVELSNLPRQILYTKDDIGAYKTEACKKGLTAVDPTIKYEGHCKKVSSANELIPIIKGASLVFNAFGYYPENEAKNLIPGYITKACIAAGIPMLCLSTNWLGPLYIPQISACYFCTISHPELAPILQKNQRNPRIDKRAFGPILSTTCSLAALEAVRYLSKIDQPKTTGGLFTIDPFNIDKCEYFPITRQVNCKYCN